MSPVVTRTIGWGLLCAAGAACGGRTLPGEFEDGGTPAAAYPPVGVPASPEADAGAPSPPESSEDASPADFGVCPPDPPPVGSACPSPVGCAYYSNAGSCQAFVCTVAGTWQVGSQRC
jgi:hypothetical protein